jgi:hypothetical protein
MKAAKMLTILLLALCLMFWHAEVSGAEPMGTAWTYQGRLLDSNGPSDGMYDFQFKLYDDANVIDGNQVGSDVNVPDVDVIDGYFTVVLEFGSDVFNGDARWLEIEVRQADSNDPNDFIALNPRQEVTPTPYALQTRGIFVDGAGNVGIGTDIPFERLEVDHGNLLVRGTESFDSADEESFVFLGDNHHYIKSGWGFGVSIGTWGVDPAIVVRETTGHVGIGTIDPQKNLSIQSTRPQIALVENGGDVGILEFHEQENQLRLQYWTDYGATWMRDMMVLDGNTGNVGIGTRDPGSRLDIKAASGYSDGGLRITSSINDNQVITLQDATPGDQGLITVKGGGTNKITLRANGDTYFNGGNVGIGTATPGKTLTIQSNRPQIALVENGGDAGVLEFHEEERQLRFQYWTDYGSTWDTTMMTLDGDTGRVGIGTTSPNQRLDVVGDAVFSGKVGVGTTSPGANLDVKSSSTSNDVIKAHASDGSELFNVIELFNGDGAVHIKDKTGTYKIKLSSSGYSFFNGGNVGIGDVGVPQEKLVVRGNILVKSESTGADVLELGQGLDYAEGFDVTENSGIEPGTVLVIDSENPGKLTVSQLAYDSKVAGIVAGANGVGSGVRLGVGQFDYDVALAGRVYCKVDATEEAIYAGDQLTTSETAGYAMKAIDHERARGAILGKAMESLAKGKKGKILVLVTLQ